MQKAIDKINEIIKQKEKFRDNLNPLFFRQSIVNHSDYDISILQELIEELEGLWEHQI